MRECKADTVNTPKIWLWHAIFLVPALYLARYAADTSPAATSDTGMFGNPILTLLTFIVILMVGVSGFMRICYLAIGRPHWSELRVDDNGLEAKREKHALSKSWEELGPVSVIPVPVLLRQFVFLCTTDGTSLGTVCCNLADGQMLKDWLEPRQIAERETPLKSLKKSGLFLCVLGLGFVAFGCFGWGYMYSCHRFHQLLKADPIRANAEVVRLYHPPVGKNCMMEYRVESEKKLREAMVEPEHWGTLKVGDIVPVLIVKEWPRGVALVEHEVDRDSLPIWFGFGLLLPLLLGLYSLRTGFWACRGWELVKDSESGKQSWRHVGNLLESDSDQAE